MEWDLKDALIEKLNIEVKVSGLRDAKLLIFAHEILVEISGAR